MRKKAVVKQGLGKGRMALKQKEEGIPEKVGFVGENGQSERVRGEAGMKLQTCGQCLGRRKESTSGRAGRCGSCRISEMWKCGGDGVREVLSVAPGPVSRSPLSERAGTSFLWGT